MMIIMMIIMIIITNIMIIIMIIVTIIMMIIKKTTQITRYRYNVGPPNEIAKLVQITSITRVYDTQITIVNGVYKPTCNWGAPPCIQSLKSSMFPVELTSVFRYLDKKNSKKHNLFLDSDGMFTIYQLVIRIL